MGFDYIDCLYCCWINCNDCWTSLYATGAEHYSIILSLSTEDDGSDKLSLYTILKVIKERFKLHLNANPN